MVRFYDSGNGLIDTSGGMTYEGSQYDDTIPRFKHLMKKLGKIKSKLCPLCSSTPQYSEYFYPYCRGFGNATLKCPDCGLSIKRYGNDDIHVAKSIINDWNKLFIQTSSSNSG